MATSATQTVKISQTILLDIDVASIDSVRIVDVDLLILLKDGQRLIVPEGAVRALMDPDFSINFKGRVFSVASLMELQTFQTQRISEVGIASKPGLPTTTAQSASPAVQQLDLSPGPAGETFSQTRSSAALTQSGSPADQATSPADSVTASVVIRPAEPSSTDLLSTEATSQARETASALDRQSEASASSPASAGVAGLSTQSPGTPVVSAELPAGPVTASLSPLWKYAVGALGAGVAALVSRAGAKAAEAVVESTLTASVTSFSGVIALGPFNKAQLKMAVYGADASGQQVRMVDTTVETDATGQYTITLEGPYQYYAGPILVLMSDANPSTHDFRSEATGAEVPLGTLRLRAAGYVERSGETTLNITPLTELAVRAALGSKADNEGFLIPTRDAINTANTRVAQAFGLGKNISVTGASVKTVLDTGFNPADTSVGTKYAWALAALSGMDQEQRLGTQETAADQAARTLDALSAHFVGLSPASAATPTTLSTVLIDRLIQGALVTQPNVQNLAKDASLNLPALLAKQIVESYTPSSAGKVLALVGSSVTTLGRQGTLLKFHFDQPVSNFKPGDVFIDQPNFSLSQLTPLDDKGMSWSAMLQPPATGVTDQSQVRISFHADSWVGNSWTWTVDTTPPPAPRALTLALASNELPPSDSGASATDGLSNVKTPVVRVALNTQASKAGDRLVLKQLGGVDDRLVLDGQQRVRNDLTRVLSPSDIGTGWVDIALNDLGDDGSYRFSVLQQDAAGNESTSLSLAYTLDTQPPGAVVVTNLHASGLIDFGDQTPPGLVNAITKAAGIVLQGVGGEPNCTISVAWGGKTVRQGVRVNPDGTWSVQLDAAAVPADNPATQLVITQVDAAGNVGAQTSYTVEVNAAGVKAQVISVQVGDDSGAVGAGIYSINAQSTLAPGQSTDDTSPVVTVQLDRPLSPDEIIQVYDNANTATPTLLFTLSGTPANLNGSYVWTSSADQWTQRPTLAMGPHVLSARVLNTYTLDTSQEPASASLPAFVVQSFNFNQLLLNADPATNLIPASQSAGSVTLNNIAVNKPILGGTLAAALGQDERLGVYDTYQGRETFLGTATVMAVHDSASQPTGAYTWDFACTTPLANGDHSLTVRLERPGDNNSDVRLAMTQDLSVALPILSIAPAVVSPNGVSTDTGWSSTDNISSNRTPMFQLEFPTMGRRAGDIVTLTNINARDASNNPTVVYTYTLTATDVAQGVANFTTSSLLPFGANAIGSRTLGLMVSIRGAAANSPVIQSAEPLTYMLDTAPPAAPVLRLLTDTSYDATTQSAFYITRVPILGIEPYDVADNKLQIQWRRNGTSPQVSAWQDSTTLPTLLTDGTQDGTWTVFARFVDVAGNASPVSSAGTLGPGAGYFSFTLDTRAPATLSTPTLLLDSTNSASASYASDRVTHDFRLRDEIPASLEVYSNPPTTARLEYRVWLDGRATPVQWFGSYLDALGAANNLSGDALTAWKQLDGNADRTAMTAMLAEGLYHVQRRQTDLAGNVSNESLDWTFTLDYQSSPLSPMLANDTSIDQRITRDVSLVLKRQGVVLSTEAEPGSRWMYELTGYTDANRIIPNGVFSSTSTYTAPTIDGYYTLRVTQTNKADVTSAGVLAFQRDTTAPDRPGAIALWAGSDTHRGMAPDDTGVGDNVSSARTPTFIVSLAPSSTASRALQAGDRLDLYLQDTSAAGTTQVLWGRRVLTQNDLDNPAREVRVIANPLTADQTYTFKTQWVDKAGNASDWGPSVTYQLDTQAQAPTIDELQLPGLPRNFINAQSSVHFTGTGEAGSLLTLRWGGRDHTVNVTQSGTWQLSVDSADFDVDTARLAFDSTVTVSQVDSAGNVSPLTTLQVAVNARSQPITAVIDQVSGANATGLIVPGQSTDERLPLLSGHLSDLLPAAQRTDGSDQPVVRVYDGAQPLGVAQVQGSQWTYQVPNALTDGQHIFRVQVYDPLTLQTGTASEPFSINSNTVMLDVRDTGNPLNWLITDTSTPTLTGTLKVPLASNESLAVYDRQADGSFRKLGTVDASAIFPTTHGALGWSYDIPVAMFGNHVYRVQVETTEGTALMTLDQAVQYDFNSLTLDPASDTGLSPEDNISGVTAPTLLIHLASDTPLNALVRLKINGSFVSGANYQHVVSEQDLAARQFNITFPDLSSLTGSNGQPTGDATYTLSATVGNRTVVDDLLYQLDTTRPHYAPNVSFRHLTGGDTGFTSDASLQVSLPANMQRAVGDLEEVQVVSAQGVEVLAWTPVDAFNQGLRTDGSRFTLPDGTYTLNTRASDVAGNTGSQSGNALTLRLDTQAAQVSSITPWSSAAADLVLQQDARLNRLETESQAPLQLKLSFSEPIQGLTLDNLRLDVSGSASSRPTLDSLTPLQPVNGYASDWLVMVTDLNHLTTGETLKLSVINGAGVLDQALNPSIDLSYDLGTVLTTDLDATLAITSVMSGGQSLPSSPDAASVTFNGAAILNGVQVSGTTTSVEPGQGVVVSLVSDDGTAVYTLPPVQVGQDGHWTASWSQPEAGTGLGMLADRSHYTLRASVQDVSGNPAQASLGVQTVLSATIAVNRVVANNAATDEVLNFVSDAPDLDVTAVDKSAGQLGHTAVAGFTVSGVTTIEAGANMIRVQLVRDGVALVTNSGAVNADGSWTVRFTGNQVRNLADGDWQLVAVGTDNAGNTASNSERIRSFTVDTQASVTLDPVSQDGRINASEDGTTLIVSGSFDDIEPQHTLSLSMRDNGTGSSSAVIWHQDNVVLNAVDNTAGTWRYELALSAWDDLVREGVLTRNAEGVASLLLTATAVDTAGNVATTSVPLTLDREVPHPPDVGPTLWQVVGDNAVLQPATQLARATTLADTTRGVVLAQAATAPTDNDIALIVVSATSAQPLTDQWRLGGAVWFLSTTVADTTLTLGSDESTLTLSYTYDAPEQRLRIQPTLGNAFTPQQVQQVLNDLAWVNTASDLALDQSERVFSLQYTDTHGNVSDARSVTFAVDTLAPVTLNQVAVTTAVTGTANDGAVVANNLNGTNTALKISAAIGAGEATGGYAEFYVGSVKLGTSNTITADDTTVSITTAINGAVTTTPAELQSVIAAGGLVSIQLYDAVGNWLRVEGPTLEWDVAPPSISSISADTPDGSYKPGDSILLRLLTDEDIAGADSALDVTLNTGSAGVPDRVVTLYRDPTNAKLFTGIYTVQPGDTSADLGVNQVSWSQPAGAVMLRDAAGNALDLRIDGLTAANTVSGSRDIQVDTTAPSAIDLVAGGVLNTAGQQHYAVDMAGVDVPLMGAVDQVSDTDVTRLILTIHGADPLNDVLTVGGLALSLDTADRSGSTTVSGIPVNWAYNASGVLTFTRPDGGAWAPTDIQALESSLTFRTYLPAQQGARTFSLLHADQAGNTSQSSTQTVVVDFRAPNAPDLDTLSNGLQRSAATYYGAVDLGTDKAVAPQADASDNDIAQITLVVGGVVDSRDQLKLGALAQALNPVSSSSGTNLTVNGVTGVDWHYSTDRVLTLTRYGGGAFTAAQVRDIERGLMFNTTAGATTGARTFTLQNTDVAGNASATSLQTFMVDTSAPVVNAVAIQGTTAEGVPKAILGVGDQVRVVLTMSEAVVVDTSAGRPTYNLVLDVGGTVPATYLEGSGTHTLTLAYTIAPTNRDTAGGVTAAASPWSLNGATLRDLAGNTGALSSLPAPAVNTLKVDTAASSPVTNMMVLDTSMPASTGGTVKVLNSSLFQLSLARGVHFGYNNTSAITIRYRQDDGSFLTFSFNDSTSYSLVANVRTAAANAFTSSTLGQAGLFDFVIDGSSNASFSVNPTANPEYKSSGDGMARMMWVYLQAKPGKQVDDSRLSLTNTFYYWLPSTATSGNPGATAVTYDTALAWGNTPPTVPGGATVNLGGSTSTTQIAVGGHLNSGSDISNGWLYQYQGLTRSSPTAESTVDTLVDNRLVFDFSASGGINKSTIFPTSVTAGSGRLNATDAANVLTLWRSKFTPASGAVPTLAEMFGAPTTFIATTIASSGGEGYMVSFETVAGSTTLVNKVTIDLGATSVKSKLLGGRFTFGSTVLKLPTSWATEGAAQVNALPTFDITLPVGVDEGSIITLYDGTISAGTLIGTKYLTAADITAGFASLAVSANTPFANTSAGAVAHTLSAKVTDNAGNVATNEGFYTYSFQDQTGPSVRAVRVWGLDSAGAIKTAPLVAGDQVMVSLTWDEAPVVTGMPTYTLNINGWPQSATYVSTSGKDMLFAYTVGDTDSSVGVTASSTALSLGSGDAIQDAVGNAANTATPVVTAFDSPVVLANPRGQLIAAQAQVLSAGASQPQFTLTFDGTLAQVGDSLVVLDDGVPVSRRLLTSSDISAGPCTLTVQTDSSLVQGSHAFTFQYVDNTGAATTFQAQGSVVTHVVSVGATAPAPLLTLSGITVDNEGGHPTRVLSDGSTYQSTSDPDLVFSGTVDQDATVTVLATSLTHGTEQSVGSQSVLANQSFSLTPTAFSLAPDVYLFKVQGQNATGQIQSVSTGPVGVWAGDTGADTFQGTAGNDRFNAGEGTNTISTGSGQDVVYLGGYSALAANLGPSSTTITDFQLGQDKIDITAVLAAGSVNSSNLMQFVSQTVSGTDTTLTIDSNGSAAGGTVHSVILRNLTQVPLDSSVLNYIVL